MPAGVSGPAVLIALLLLVLAFCSFGGTWHLHRQRRILLETPTSPAGALPQGRVEVKGVSTLAPGSQPLVAPFSGKPCLHWRFVVEEERTRTQSRTINGKRQTYTERYWHAVAQQASPEPFGVRDETGIALVDPRGAEMPATSLATLRSGLFRDPPPEVLRVLQQTGIAHEGLFGLNKSMRYRESALGEGTRLFVAGTARPSWDGRLAIGRGDDGRLLVSTRSEESILRGYLAGMVLTTLAGLGLAAGGLYVLLR